MKRLKIRNKLTKRNCNRHKIENNTRNSIKVSPPKPGGLKYFGSDLEMISKTFKATKLHRAVFFYDSIKQRVIFLTDEGIYDGKSREKIEMLADIECYTKMEA